MSPGLLDPWSGSLASMDRSGVRRKNFYVCASQTLLTRVCPVEAKTGRKRAKITQRALGGSSAELHLKKSQGEQGAQDAGTSPVSIPCLPLLLLLLICPLHFLRSLLHLVPNPGTGRPLFCFPLHDRPRHRPGGLRGLASPDPGP